MENRGISREKWHYFTAIPWILVQLQTWEWEVKERLIMHNLRTDHVTIGCELRYLMGAKLAGIVIWKQGPGSTWPENPRLMSGRENNPTEIKGAGFRPGLEPYQIKPLATNRTASGIPPPVAYTIDHRRLYTKNRWRSVDTLLTHCWCTFLAVVTTALNILPIKTNPTSIMSIRHSTALGLSMIQCPKSLMLRWCSFEV
jgi:hypothetical protein